MEFFYSEDALCEIVDQMQTNAEMLFNDNVAHSAYAKLVVETVFVSKKASLTSAYI